MIVTSIVYKSILLASAFEGGSLSLLSFPVMLTCLSSSSCLSVYHIYHSLSLSPVHKYKHIVSNKTVSVFAWFALVRSYLIKYLSELHDPTITGKPCISSLCGYICHVIINNISQETFAALGRQLGMVLLLMQLRVL